MTSDRAIAEPEAAGMGPFTPRQKIEEEAREGDWYVLWPGEDGPFTACWGGGQWFFASTGDLAHAALGVRINAEGQNLTRRGHTRGDFELPRICPECGHPLPAKT